MHAQPFRLYQTPLALFSAEQFSAGNGLILPAQEEDDHVASVARQLEAQRHMYAAGFLASAILFLLFIYVSWIQARHNIAAQKSTGLGAVAEEPLGFLWVQGTVGGVPGGVESGPLADSAASRIRIVQAAEDRQIARQAAMVIAVARPDEAATEVSRVVERVGGQVISLNRSEDTNRQQIANLMLSMPAARFDEARAEIRKLAARVENEKVEAEDITRSYVDRVSRLNSRRAVERQYLEVLRRAQTVKEILEVHEKLGEVREEIETAEGEIKLMSHRVAMSAIAVTLRSEKEPVVLGIRWDARSAFKRAANSGLAALTDYISTVVEFAMLLPVILLWVITVFFAGGLAWRLLRWLWRFFIVRPSAQVAGS